MHWKRACRVIPVLLGWFLAWAPPAAAQAPPAGTPPSGPRPAQPGSGAAPSSPAGAGPGSSAAPTSPAAPPAATPARSLTVRVPSGGSYTAYLLEAPESLRTLTESGQLPLPTEARQVTVYVLDPRSGYAGRKSVTLGAGPPPEVTFAGPDFRLLQKVRVTATGKDGLPLAEGLVTLTDGSRIPHRRVLQAPSAGVVEFDMVVSGAGQVSVTPTGGSTTTREVTLELPRGETVLAVAVALPEAMNTVAAPAAPPTLPQAETPGQAAPAATPNAAAPQAAAPTASPAAPVAPAVPIPPASPGGGWA